MITTTVPAGSVPSPREEEASSDAGAVRWAGLSRRVSQERRAADGP